MVLTLSILSVAFAAFCVWLTVRIANRRERWAKWTLAAVAVMASYPPSYVGIRLARPDCINTNDGPIRAFTQFYYPLRYIDATIPEWFSKTDLGWLTVKINGNNPGNGRIHFSWAGGEATAFSCADLGGFKEGDPAQVHFCYKLETFDDFQSRLVPYIDEIKPP